MRWLATRKAALRGLREYADAGARTVIGYSACPAEYVDENQALFAKEILPAFR